MFHATTFRRFPLSFEYPRNKQEQILPTRPCCSQNWDMHPTWPKSGFFESYCELDVFSHEITIISKDFAQGLLDICRLQTFVGIFESKEWSAKVSLTHFWYLTWNPHHSATGLNVKCGIQPVRNLTPLERNFKVVSVPIFVIMLSRADSLV